MIEVNNFTIILHNIQTEIDLPESRARDLRKMMSADLTTVTLKESQTSTGNILVT